LHECRSAWAVEGADYSYEDWRACAARGAAEDDPSPGCVPPPRECQKDSDWCRANGQVVRRAGDFAASHLEGLALRYGRYWRLGIGDRPPGHGHPHRRGAPHMVLNQFVADATGRVVVAALRGYSRGNILVASDRSGELGRSQGSEINGPKLVEPGKKKSLQKVRPGAGTSLRQVLQASLASFGDGEKFRCWITRFIIHIHGRPVDHDVSSRSTSRATFGAHRCPVGPADLISDFPASAGPLSVAVDVGGPGPASPLHGRLVNQDARVCRLSAYLGSRREYTAHRAACPTQMVTCPPDEPQSSARSPAVRSAPGYVRNVLLNLRRPGNIWAITKFATESSIGVPGR